MIKNTFSILNGVGEKRERRLWAEGILTWEDFLDADELSGINPDLKRLSDESLFHDLNALNTADAHYFQKRVKRREHWRLFDCFQDDAVCLDIETNGLPPDHGGYVTVVGLYDGYDYKHLLRGENLTPESLDRELSRYKCLITFYGSVFDIPFLLRTFRGLRLDMPHYDLCFAAKRVNIHGGLKKIEHEFGVKRDESVQGLNGYEAVRLWEFGQRGSSEAIDLLVQYNKEDTVNLIKLAPVLYRMLRQSTGIEEYLPCGIA